MAGVEDTWQEGMQGYRSYLLRCWQESKTGSEGESTWVFILVPLHEQHTKKGFPALEELFEYLRIELSNELPGGRFRLDSRNRFTKREDKSHVDLSTETRS